MNWQKLKGDNIKTLYHYCTCTGKDVKNSDKDAKGFREVEIDSDGVCKDCGYYTMSLTRKAHSRSEMYSMLRLDKKEEENYYITDGAVTDLMEKIDNPYSKKAKFKINQDKIKIDFIVKEEIKELLKTKTQKTIASIYNVTQSTISQITKDIGMEKYKGLKKLDNESIREIKRLLRQGGNTQATIAKRFGISKSVISNISRGKIYKNI